MQRPAAPARADPRHRGGVPGRQRRFAVALRARLAHHQHVRRDRCRGRDRQAARARCAADGLRDRPRGESGVRAGGKPRQHGEERERRQCAAQRDRRGTARRARVHRRARPRSRASAASRGSWGRTRTRRRSSATSAPSGRATKNAYKPYPCGIVLHPVIDALLELRARHELRAEQIERVTVRGHPLLRQRTDRKRPRSGREAQVSLQHTAAVCLIYGKAGVAEYGDARAIEPAVQAFGDRVEVHRRSVAPGRGDRGVRCAPSTAARWRSRSRMRSAASPAR